MGHLRQLWIWFCEDLSAACSVCNLCIVTLSRVSPGCHPEHIKSCFGLLIILSTGIFFACLHLVSQPNLGVLLVSEKESSEAFENTSLDFKIFELNKDQVLDVIENAQKGFQKVLQADNIQRQQVQYATQHPGHHMTSRRRSTKTHKKSTTVSPSVSIQQHSVYRSTSRKMFSANSLGRSFGTTQSYSYTTEPPRILVESDDPDSLQVPEFHTKFPMIDCAALFEGEKRQPVAFRRAIRKTKIKVYNSKSLSSKELYKATENCSAFLRARKYILDSITKEEEEFSIAYSIVMYSNSGQAERLLRAIYRPQNYYCLHVDAKANLETELIMTRVAACFNNVFVVEKPASVDWAYYGVLEAEFICMRELVKYKKWKYYINLTGHEFPLKSNYEIVRILKIYNGSNEISNLPIGLYTHRFEWSHIPGRGRTIRRKSPPPHNITIHKGDAHVTLTRAFVEYILTDQVVLDFAEWLRDTYCPEEFFFSSLHYNAHIKAPGTWNVDYPYYHKVISRHKVWVSEGRSLCKSGNYRNTVCIYGIRDLPDLAHDHQALFINKLMDDFEPITYDCLEELYFNRTRDEYLGKKGFDFNFYTRRKFISHHY